jgi:hypothetical protein
MDDNQIIDLLLAAEVLDERESVIRQRLLHQEKVDILAAVQQHGAGAVAQLTKGDQVIYDRDAEAIAGPDEDFLDWAIFRSPPGASAEDLIYDGPETVFLLAMDHSYPGRAVIGSWSPFTDRAAYQTPEGSLANDQVVYGYRFSATMQLRNALHVLEQHGRLERVDRPSLPAVADQDWQGGWIAKTHAIAPELETPDGQMASEIGPIEVDGGDYLRFMLLVRRIMACALSDTDKANLIHRSASFQGEGGHSFDRFIDFHGGGDALLRKLHRHSG